MSTLPVLHMHLSVFLQMFLDHSLSPLSRCARKEPLNNYWIEKGSPSLSLCLPLSNVQHAPGLPKQQYGNYSVFRRFDFRISGMSGKGVLEQYMSPKPAPKPNTSLCNMFNRCSLLKGLGMTLVF